MGLVHDDLPLRMLPALGEGQGEGQEAAVIQTLEGQKEEGPSLGEDPEGEERKTRAWRCWPGRSNIRTDTRNTCPTYRYRSMECTA